MWRHFLWRWYKRTVRNYLMAFFVYCRKLDLIVRFYSVVNMSKCTLILLIDVFLCPECSCIYLWCIPVIFYCHFTSFSNIAIKHEVWLAIKLGSTHHLFKKCPVRSQDYGSCYQIVRIWMLHWRLFCCISVFLLFVFFLIVDVHPSVLVSNPDSFSLNRFMFST